MEVWEKVFIKDAEFMQSTHGKVGCVICHGGDSQVEDKELAHAGIVTDPSEINCSTCHQDIAVEHDMSLHVRGYRHYLRHLSPGHNSNP